MSRLDKKLYIVDAIGIHCGMNYYAESFVSIIKENGLDCKILSNYSTCGAPYFNNFYSGSTLKKVAKLIVGCIKLFLKTLFDRKSVYIFFSYGNLIDFLLLFSTLFVNNRIIDVHEVIAQGFEKNKLYRKLFTSIYRHTSHVIIHSKRSEVILSEIGYKGNFLFVPHFAYQTTEEYDIALVDNDVRNLIKDKINILWFGNITYSKGIDIYISNILSLSKNIKEKINVVVAGRSLDGVFEKCDTSDSVFSVVLRRLNDDEMTYLYTSCDYVILPYRQTSQSGVLEMAFHYMKPVIVSKIPYFEMMLNKYPSFGIVTDISQEEFSRTIEDVALNKRKFYTEEDIYRYSHRKEIQDFGVNLKKLIDTL